MAVYRTVQVNFWQDDFVLDLTPEERYFYVYLLTCSKTTQCGIFPFPKRLAEMETGYNRETVDKLVQRFVDYGKILYDADTRELFVLNWLRYNPVTNTNVEKCVLRELKGVKNKEFVHMFLQKCVEEELNVPMLLAHFGMPGDLAVDDVDPVCEEAEEEEGEERVEKVRPIYRGQRAQTGHGGALFHLAVRPWRPRDHRGRRKSCSLPVGVGLGHTEQVLRAQPE